MLLRPVRLLDSQLSLHLSNGFSGLTVDNRAIGVGSRMAYADTDATTNLNVRFSSADAVGVSLCCARTLDCPQPWIRAAHPAWIGHGQHQAQK